MSADLATCDQGASGQAFRARVGARIHAYDVVRIALGLLLLLAAGLKGFQLATEPISGETILNSRWFLITLVEFELIFGLWLLAGLQPHATRRVALGWFVLLAMTSLYKAFSGEVNCGGCFGKLTVNPWYTFLIDVVAIAALWATRPTTSQRERQVRFTVAKFALCAALFAVSAALFMGAFSSAKLLPDGLITGDSDIVVLEPETWLGKRFPLLSHIDIGRELSSGSWQVILYRHNCPKCHALIVDYRQTTRGLTQKTDRRQIVFVELPPFAHHDDQMIADSGFRRGRLSDQRQWFVTLPVSLVLRDGVVTSYHDEASRPKIVLKGIDDKRNT